MDVSVKVRCLPDLRRLCVSSAAIHVRTAQSTAGVFAHRGSAPAAETRKQPSVCEDGGIFTQINKIRVSRHWSPLPGRYVDTYLTPNKILFTRMGKCQQNGGHILVAFYNKHRSLLQSRIRPRSPAPCSWISPACIFGVNTRFRHDKTPILSIGVLLKGL